MQEEGIPEESIHSLKKIIQDLTAEKQQIISLVSHDIKAPLNRVFALVQLLNMENENLNDEQRNYLDKMHLVVADGLGLIRNLADYRNLEYRKVEITNELINVPQLIQLVIRNFASLATKKKLTIKLDLPTELSVRSDHHCLIRALENLISNAVKFSEENTLIGVRAKRSGDDVMISIQDEARGFTSEDLNNLFKKFQKFSARPTGGESTTGLGLYIAKAMIENAGGKITCLTTEGIGSVFTIVLPAAE